MRRSSSLATRLDKSSRRSTPRAAAMRPGAPKALIRTGTSDPWTLSKRRATFFSAGPLEIRSVISAISRSRETGAVTRRSWPCLSRWAMNSRRSAKAMAWPHLLLVDELHDEAGDDREGQARQHADQHEAPPHERRLPRDDPL